MINDKDLARLTNALQVPIVVQDILDGRESLAGDVQYGLHEIISNYQPDSALLCIALSAHRIAQRYLHLSPNMAVLRMEAERVIEEYAPLWLAHARRRPVDDNILMDTLADIPEDLESLAELLDIAVMYLSRKNVEAVGLCEVLAIQARAQALVADAFVGMMEKNAAASPKIQDNTPPAGLVSNAPRYAGNVIPFPYYARA